MTINSRSLETLEGKLVIKHSDIEGLVKKAWNNLMNDCKNGKFRPECESDIMAHLYHHLLIQAQNMHDLVVRTEYPFNRERKTGKKTTQHIDLVILKKEGYPLALIEIKETKSAEKSGEHRIDLRKFIKNKIKSDISKLRYCWKQKGSRQAKLYICFFFRYAPKNADDVHKKIKEVEKSYENKNKGIIKILWGSFQRQDEEFKKGKRNLIK